ncbi:MAG: hypothetical protein ACUVRV_01060 [Cyanobacteriota bacterium]
MHITPVFLWQGICLANPSKGSHAAHSSRWDRGFGRPKRDRRFYLQWQAAGIPPQVVFKILCPGNCFSQRLEKLRFYERYGAEEYYIYDQASVA